MRLRLRDGQITYRLTVAPDANSKRNGAWGTQTLAAGWLAAPENRLRSIYSRNGTDQVFAIMLYEGVPIPSRRAMS